MFRNVSGFSKFLILSMAMFGISEILIILAVDKARNMKHSGTSRKGKMRMAAMSDGLQL